MKCFLFSFCFLLGRFLAFGQPSYPAAIQPPGKLISAEYFFDSDPGVGNGVEVFLAPSEQVELFTFPVSLAGLSSGFHRVYIRCRSENGSWSLAAQSYFDNYLVPAYALAPAGPATIQSIEYFFDTDPGAGNGYPITTEELAELGDRPYSINVTDLPGGVHRISVRAKDATGNWSLTHFGVFDNGVAVPYPVSPGPVQPVSELEYYIDNDPGFGKGTAINVTSGDDISNFSIDVPLSSVTAGNHTLYIRSRQNPWSFSAYADFTFSGALPVTWLFVKAEILGEDALISWATASEQNAAYFLVEHSTDGEHFEEIGRVDAVGNSSSTQHYSFLFEDLRPGMNVFRLKQMDVDGRYSFSKFVQLLFRPGNSKPILAPNPVGSELLLYGFENQHVKSIELYDLSGKRLLQRPVSLAAQPIRINMRSFQTGVYVLRVTTTKAVESFMVRKQ